MTADQSMAALARVAWRQWTGIGVTGRIEPATAPVDPEALIVLTSRLADHDIRLRDAAVDWCVAAGHLVNGARLSRVAGEAGLRQDQDLRRFFATVRVAGGPDWGAGRVAPAAHSGRGKVSLTSLAGDARLLLYLRASVGVNARADVLLRLLANDEAITIPSLVAATHFTRADIDKTLSGLELAGHIEVISSRQRDRKVRLKAQSPFRTWPHPQAPVYDWPNLFDVAMRSVTLAQIADEQPDAVFGIEARTFIERERKTLADARIASPATSMSGSAFVGAARAWVAGLPAEMDKLSH